MESFVILAVSAISSGCLYGLVGMALAIIYSASKLINFAQGEFVMLGSMCAYVLIVVAGVGFVPSMLLAAAMVGVVGIAVMKFVMAPHLARGTASFSMIIVLMGVSIFIGQATLIATGAVGYSVPYAFGSGSRMIFGVPLQPHHFLVIGVTILVTIGYWFLMNRSMLGLATRAVGFNRDMAFLTGINVSRIVMFSFLLSAAISGLAGALVAPLIGFRPLMGMALVFKGFMALVIGGGFGKPYGALLGGIFIAALSTLLTGLGFSEFADAATFLAMLAVIIWRPTGLTNQADDH
jgi:branched-chain amino acid transport system permease protein